MAVNLDNSEENFTEGKVWNFKICFEKYKFLKKFYQSIFQTDIFSGIELKECYDFEVGNVASNSDFGM